MPLAVLFAFFAFLFRDALFNERFLLVGDPLKQFYPLRTMIWASIRDGHFPLWIPHILSGYPTPAMAMLGLGYPLTWSYLVLPGWWAEQLYVLAPYALAPLFTYLFLREWDRSREGALLGALTYGYGGFLFSPIGLTGVHANSALWLPLVLLGVARARRRPLLGSLTIAAAGYTMSILAGSGQMFLYSGALALAYGAYLALAPDRDEARSRRWHPLVTATGAIVISAGLTAFQMFETWTAVHQSVREGYPASRVAEGSFPFMLAVRSMLQPLGNYWDSSTFVPLLALGLAIVGVIAGRGSRETRFWAFVAVVSWILVLGSNTPLFELYSRLPFVGRFRYPSRHSMEWSFAIGVLASYGWDFAEARVAALRRRDTPAPARMVVGALLLTACAAFAAWQWRAFTISAGLDVVTDLNNAITTLSGGYMAWKLAFTACIGVAIALLWRMQATPWRSSLVASILAFGCFVEPYLWMVRPVVVPFSAPRALFGTTAEATKVAKKHLVAGQRTFSVPHPYAVSTAPERDVDAVNWTALAGLEDVNGYESLILARYSRAMTGAVDTEPFVYPDARLLDPGSRVLDLLGVGCVISYSGMQASPGSPAEKDGVRYSNLDLAYDLRTDKPYIFTAGDAAADTLFVVTTLGNAGDVTQGEKVAHIRVIATDGSVIELDLLAGVHTSELMFDRADVKAHVRHRLAPVFDSSAGDAAKTFDTHRFLARFDLGRRVAVRRVEIVKTTTNAGVGLWKASLADMTAHTSAPLPLPDRERWVTLHDRNGVVVMQNRRALPRAWLVPRIETLDEAEILHRIRGESDAPFDPRSTALLEPDSGARAVKALEPFARKTAFAASLPPVRIDARDTGRLVFQTEAAEQAMLVVSEVHYPGWVATIDGRRAPVHRTNFFLRGVSVPPGRHTVEMRYTAPGLRKGGRISIATLLLILVAAASRRLRTV